MLNIDINNTHLDLDQSTMSKLIITLGEKLLYFLINNFFYLKELL